MVLFGSAIRVRAVISFAPKMRGMFEKAIELWKSTKQPHPRCEGHQKLARIPVVKDLMKPTYGGRNRLCMSAPVNDSSLDRNTILYTIALREQWSENSLKLL